MRRNSTHPPLDTAISRLAARQHGVVAQRQLIELGLSGRGVRNRVERGRLHRVHRGVYSVGHPLLSPKGRAMAAVLACGPGAVLSHRAAADLLGLRSSSATKIDVTVRGTGGRGHEQIAVHRSRTLLDRDVIEVDGIPCTSVARTLLDLAELVDHDSLVKAIERAEIQQLFDLRALEDVLDRAHGRRSAARLRAAIAEVAIRPPTRNDLEQAFFEICVKARLPRPAVNRWIQVDGTSYQADFSWDDLGLIAETDGYETHGTRTAFENDRKRDQRLSTRGWRIVRFTWRQVMYEPSAVAKTLRGLSAASPAPAR